MDIRGGEGAANIKGPIRALGSSYFEESRFGGCKGKKRRSCVNFSLVSESTFTKTEQSTRERRGREEAEDAGKQGSLTRSCKARKLLDR